MLQPFAKGRLLYCFSALAITFILVLLCLLSILMLNRGLSLFWPTELIQFRYQHAGQSIPVAGEVVKRQSLTQSQLVALGYLAKDELPHSGKRVLVKQGYQTQSAAIFAWYWQDQISDWHLPESLSLVRHNILGDVYGEVIAQTDKAITFQLIAGEIFTFELSDIERQLQPNSMSLWQKLGVFFSEWWHFLSSEPREANTGGGIFPAIVGTLLSVMLMALLVAPIGIMAGVYLHEYAKDSRLVRLVRLSVHNLAGVPSVVFGVFGLGFFVYVLGANIDQLFYSDQLPQPTFGTPGLIWVSLTLALLTLPVVIVATEEGLARVPVSLRLGGYALGATKAEVLRKLILPIARPAMITGVILAISRAAGEVAPLIFVGVVKYAPNIPLSKEFPFVLVDQQIMSLGFQIYDVGLQSANADAAEPRVYAIALVLLCLIGVLNILAMWLRAYYRIQARHAAS
jgi:phosphate ABC transporter permease subunit PstA